ncbi:MAG: WD40 repeat domain-containing protein [Treponema sp.]|jgi:WD40 repeat protein|nr:WD40 repeat domain-containing protein [Treponema sp.]
MNLAMAKRILAFSMFMTTLMNITADSSAGGPGDELERGIKETVLAVVTPLANRKPYITVGIGDIAFPDLGDTAKKREGAERVIGIIIDVLASMEGRVTLLDYETLVRPTLYSNNIKEPFESIDKQTAQNIINYLELNYLIRGSIEGGRFTINLIPSLLDDNDGMNNDIEISKSSEFNPGASNIYMELLDGWSPGELPKSESWKSPGNISALAFIKDGLLAVGVNSTEKGAYVIILDPRTRAQIMKITFPAKVNALFYDNDNKVLLAALHDRIQAYDANYNLRLTIPANNEEPCTIASGMGKALVTTMQGGVFVYDLETGEPLALPQPFNTRGETARGAVSPDGTTFAITAGSTAWVLPGTTMRTRYTIRGDKNFTAVSLSSGEKIYLGTAANIEMYQGETLIRTIGTDRANNIKFSDNGLLMLAGGNKLNLLRENTGLLLFTLANTGTPGKEYDAIAYSSNYTAAALGQDLMIFNAVPEPGAVVNIRNNASGPVRLSLDRSLPVIIAANSSYDYGVLIPDSQRQVTVEFEEEGGNDNFILSRASLTLRPGRNENVTITDNRRPKARLARQDRLQVTALAAAGSKIVAGYASMIRGKTTIVSAEMMLLDLKKMTPQFLRPHRGEITGAAINDKYIASGGSDSLLNIHSANGDFLFSAKLKGTPIGLELDTDKILIVYENGMSVANISNLTAAGNTGTPLNSAHWKGRQITPEEWKEARSTGDTPFLLTELDGKSIVAADSISIKNKLGTTVAEFGLYKSLEWALAAAQGYFTGSSLANQHVCVQEGNTERKFSDNDKNLIDINRVRTALENAGYISQ